LLQKKGKRKQSFPIGKEDPSRKEKGTFSTSFRKKEEERRLTDLTSWKKREKRKGHQPSPW